MGADYHVAVHQADWPTNAEVNVCLGGLNYPVRVVVEPPSDMDKPLRADGYGLKVIYEGAPVALEASTTQLSAKDSFAYGIKVENGQTVFPKGMDDFVPLDLNTELRKLGMDAPDFGYGDFVLSLTFRSSVTEWKAGFLLMAGLIHCTRGVGFEFSEGAFGGERFADKLVREAAEME